MRRKDQFDFKQFSIVQRNSAMKVGTDGVLLGAWIPLNNPKNILDIGTGTGLIALMLAQRSPESFIEAIDIDPLATSEAAENFERSTWANNLLAINKSLQEFSLENQKTYDLIVSNPPFFNSGSVSPYGSRHQSRHSEGNLSHEALLSHVVKLLSDNGTFTLIIPYKEGLEFLENAIEKKLYPSKKLAFFSNASKPQKRWLFEFKKKKEKILKNKLIQYNPDNQWSEDYKKLTKAFYLKI